MCQGFLKVQRWVNIGYSLQNTDSNKKGDSMDVETNVTNSR